MKLIENFDTFQHNPYHLLKSAIPGAYAGTTVATVYGPSRIQAVRADGIHVARPLNWKLANDTGKCYFFWWHGF